jgi:putative ABC transport system ATP-binding protein
VLEAVRIGRVVNDRVLLQDISLTVQPGQRIALVGPSGSGKTLLLRALAMLDPLNHGEIRWQHQTISGAAVPRFRSQVMYLHQRPSLLEGTVEENLRQPFLLRVHREKSFDPQRVTALLDSVDRDATFLQKKQRDLSGGESQLAAIIRAIQLDPSVLLLDEPTSALDALAVQLVESLVTRWFEEKPQQRATIWVSHDAQQASRTSTILQKIRDGRLENGAGI